MNVLLEYLLPFVKVGGLCLCMKGPNVKEEMENTENALKILGGSIQKIENIKEYYIDGISWKVEYNPMFSYFAKFRVQIENMIGCHIDGFIGTDCMKGKCVVINFINQELSISSSDMNE